MFNGSNRYYVLNNGNTIEYIENLTGAKTLTIQCVNSKNEVLKEQSYKILTNRYTKESLEVEGYEAKDAILSGEITEDKTIQAMYYLVCEDDSTLVFTQIDGGYAIGTSSGDWGRAVKSAVVNLDYVVKIPEKYNGQNVTRVYSGSFSDWRLKKVYISDNINILDANAFYQCSNLNYVRFGNQVSSMDVGGEVFNGCYNLTKNSFDLSENNTAFKIVDGVLYSYDMKKLILYPCGEIGGNFVIPDSVDTLGRTCCIGGRMESVYIPSSITTWDGGGQFRSSYYLTKAYIYSDIIGGMSFTYGCAIKEAVVGTNVTRIKQNAFLQCLNLETINYEGTIEQWGEIIKENQWYNGGTNIKKIICTNGEINL